MKSSKGDRGTPVWGRGGVLALALVGNVANAADVYLRATPFEQAMYDGRLVPMWGFATCDATFTTCDPPSAPGPQLHAVAGEPLTVHVDNQLPVPISFTVPGQGGGGDPVYVADGLGRQRARSFTHEVAPGTSSTYAFAGLNAGTFLYQTGSHPSIQVPMGLYGAMVVGPGGAACAGGQSSAYATAETCHDADAVLVFSEVDPDLNDAVAAAASEADYPSTIGYLPTYLLVNGHASATLPSVAPGTTLLLRMLNAGLETRYSELAGATLGVLARDGFTLPGRVHHLASAEVPAGTTLDASLTTPTTDVTLGMMDRGARSTYSGAPASAVVSVVVGAGSPDDPSPTVYTVADSLSLDEDTSAVGASVLTNDVGLSGAGVSLFTPPSHGTVAIAADGTYVYSPDPDFAGEDAFAYVAVLGGVSFPGTVIVDVGYVNDAPEAADDEGYTNMLGADVVVAAPGVLGNDRDVDGDTLTAEFVSGPATGIVTLAADGSFTWTGGAPGTSATFTYRTFDGQAYSAPATVTVSAEPVAGIALTVRDAAGVAISDYRWVVQEDVSFKNDPANPPSFPDMQSGNFHKSWYPVVAQGTTRAGGGDDFAQVALDPSKHYYVSVLPLDGGQEEGGHSLSGAQILPGATSVSVIVASHPIPTARLSVLVFEDLTPVNGAWDLGEPGYGGYTVTLEDAGGRYGQNGGTASQDVFGNPLRNALDCFGGNEPPAGVILSCPDGSVLVENLPPGKYGVTVTPPPDVAGSRIQTTTLEGTRVVDAWVQAGEPPFMIEFGAGPHAFIGFVDPSHTVVPDSVPAADRTNTVTGHVTLYHDPRPPGAFGTVQTGNYDALSYTQAWIGLNSAGGNGPSYATVQADAEGNFTIEGLPNGDYQLVIWDEFLDQIINLSSITLTGGVLDLGAQPVFAWFTRLEHNVFLDANENGTREAGEEGLPEQNVNVRFRDGSIFQSFPTDTEGFVPFDELFPFFSWQVAEVDFARFKATGVTVTVDGGGDTSTSPYPGILSLQEGSPRTETGPVLLEAFQNFPGQTSIMDWGKAPYHPGENGGISGIVYYASTRGEHNPRLGVGDPWERGVPGVTVRLYREVSTAAGSGALVLVSETHTDSWDDAMPTGCPGEDAATPYVTSNLGPSNLDRCYDGWRNYNQIRPGVFDGGYAFMDIDPGDYVVEVVPPPGFEIVKEEDVNVVYGDVFEMAPAPVVLPGGAAVVVVPDMASIVDSTAQPGLAQPECVGATHTVPEFLSLFPDAETLSPYAGYERATCDRKRVRLSDQGQAAADFFLFTGTPIATQFTGMVLDDLAIEHDPRSPNFGEKWAPAFLPISIRDFTGHEVYHTFSDGYGRYNGMAASTYSANIPNPSGYSPAMYSVCLNRAGTVEHPEPYRNMAYGEICATLQFMPGTTTYADTPVLPNGAFSAGYNPPDCTPPSGAPVIRSVTNGLVGPAGGIVRMTSLGQTQVPNPAWRGPGAAAPYDREFITRDYGFGTGRGTVKLGNVTLPIQTWSDGTITARVPVGTAPGAYQLTVTNAAGVATIAAVTVTVGNEVPTFVPPGGSIQAAVDAAPPGGLIVVPPGVYQETLVLWKPVRLQGAGAGSTVIDARPQPSRTLEAWRTKVAGLVSNGLVDLLPGQVTNLATMFGGGVFANEMGAGILVLAKDGVWDTTESRIDGFTIRNASVGGGVVVNGYANNLDISNNYITSNGGWLGGGVRVGDPLLSGAGNGPYGWNPNVHIHHNLITSNGATADQSGGGGVTLSTGSDGYEVTDNVICGNLTTGSGAGIGHLGLSDNGRIAHNLIAFNQDINPTFTQSGGGIYVGGLVPAPPATTVGAGDVTIERNQIQGNTAASGHGGGVRVEYFNGADVAASADPNTWYALTMTNNIVVNNVATWSGGGVSLADVARGTIRHNTIAHNDSTATAGPLIDLVANTSPAQPAGIAAELHTAELLAALPAGSVAFSNPEMSHNIIWRNRAFHYDGTSGSPQLVPVLNPTSVGQCAPGATYWDSGVLASDAALTMTYSILTVASGPTNRSVDPSFQLPYCNGTRLLGAAGGMNVAVATDEGGNAVEVAYGPLVQLGWDYHLRAGSPAINYLPTAPTGITVDFDGQVRPNGPRADVGADEFRIPAVP